MSSKPQSPPEFELFTATEVFRCASFNASLFLFEACAIPIGIEVGLYQIVVNAAERVERSFKL